MKRLPLTGVFLDADQHVEDLFEHSREPRNPGADYEQDNNDRNLVNQVLHGVPLFSFPQFYRLNAA